MIDPRKTVELHEVEDGYFRGITGDLASNNEELKAENERLLDLDRRQSRHWNALVEWLNWEGHTGRMSGRELAAYLLDVILDPAWDYEAYLQDHPDRDWDKWKKEAPMNDGAIGG